MTNHTLIARRTAAAMVLALSLTLAGCGSSSSASSTGAGPSKPASSVPSKSTSAGPVTVAIRGFAYSPPALSVAVGTRVTFTNHDATAHTATSSSGSAAFDTGSVKPGQSATVTLKSPGAYSYICQFHPFMHGTVTVK